MAPYHFAVALEGNAAGEDHDLAVVRGVDAEELAAGLGVLARSLVAMSKAREV
jgi:hypothetical protein